MHPHCGIYLSFLSLNNVPLYATSALCFSVHLSIGPWVASTFLAIMENGTINMGVQISFQDTAFNSFGYIHVSGIAGSCVCSVTKSCPTLCDPMVCSIPGFPALQHLPGFAQTHVHWVGDAIYLSDPLPPPLHFAFNLSQHQVFSNELALCIRWSDYWSFRSVLSMNIQG